MCSRSQKAYAIRLIVIARTNFKTPVTFTRSRTGKASFLEHLNGTMELNSRIKPRLCQHFIQQCRRIGDLYGWEISRKFVKRPYTA